MTAQVLWIFYDTLSKTQSNPVSTTEAQSAILKMDPKMIERFFVWTAGWKNWQELKAYLESDQKNFVSTFTIPIPRVNKETSETTTEATVRNAIKDILEKTQTQSAYKNQKEKKEDTRSFSNISLNEETISRIVKEEAALAQGYYCNEGTWSNIKTTVQKPALDFSSLTKKTMSSRETRHELKIEVLFISAKGKTFRSRSKNISLSGCLLEDTIPFDFYGTTFEVVIINTHTKNPLKARVKLNASVAGDVDGLARRVQYINPTDLQKQSLKILLEDYLHQQKTTSNSA